MSMESFYIQTPIGRLQISCVDNKVTEVNLGMDNKKSQQQPVNDTNGLTSPFARNIRKQMDRYFAGLLENFSIDLAVQGTAYQKSVWRVISTIKQGTTLTYTDVAEQLGSSARAVGNACRANPTPIIVPCHRVVSKSGLGGFAGQREGSNIKVKTWLLEHELGTSASLIAT